MTSTASFQRLPAELRSQGANGMMSQGPATKGHTPVLVRTEGSETSLSTFTRSMMAVAKTLRVLVFREKCPLP
jgi:hypothetical protein